VFAASPGRVLSQVLCTPIWSRDDGRRERARGRALGFAEGGRTWTRVDAPAVARLILVDTGGAGSASASASSSTIAFDRFGFGFASKQYSNVENVSNAATYKESCYMKEKETKAK